MLAAARPSKTINAVRQMLSFSAHPSSAFIFSQVNAHVRLQLTGQKLGEGAYTDQPFICTTHIYVNHMRYMYNAYIREP